MKRNMAIRGGGQKNIVGLKRGGGAPKNSLKFCSDDICNNVNSPPECQKLAFVTFRKFKFYGGSMLSDHLLCYAQKAILPNKNTKKHKSIPNQMFHREKITNSVRGSQHITGAKRRIPPAPPPPLKMNSPFNSQMNHS